jgi:lactoylglutathione lyase
MERRRRRTRHTVGPCDAGVMTQKPRARLVGSNHVALEVGDIEAALALYGRLFEFELRGRAGRMAFVDIGDQFLALAQGRSQAPDQGRHFGLVVDDKEAVRAAVVAEGLATLGRPPALQFLDPWGNRLEIVAYSEVQFERVPAVKRKLGIEALAKTERARAEIAERGLG